MRFVLISDRFTKQISALKSGRSARSLQLAALVSFFTIALNSLSPASQILDIADLKVARLGHTATPLANGRVLIIGGQNADGPIVDAEIFNPETRTFRLAAKSLQPRTEHTATELSDGRIFVVGGRADGQLLASSEIFDPRTNSFSRGPALNRARAGHSATVLQDGRLLVLGGDDDGSAEILNSETRTFDLLEAHLQSPRSLHGTALLRNGKVLIAGGLNPEGAILGSAQIFDPETLSFASSRTPMHIARMRPTLLVLGNANEPGEPACI